MRQPEPVFVVGDGDVRVEPRGWSETGPRLYVVEVDGEPVCGPLPWVMALAVATVTRRRLAEGEMVQAAPRPLGT